MEKEKKSFFDTFKRSNSKNKTETESKKRSYTSNEPLPNESERKSLTSVESNKMPDPIRRVTPIPAVRDRNAERPRVQEVVEHFNRSLAKRASPQGPRKLPGSDNNERQPYETKYFTRSGSVPSMSPTTPVKGPNYSKGNSLKRSSTAKSSPAYDRSPDYRHSSPSTGYKYAVPAVPARYLQQTSPLKSEWAPRTISHDDVRPPPPMMLTKTHSQRDEKKGYSIRQVPPPMPQLPRNGDLAAPRPAQGNAQRKISGEEMQAWLLQNSDVLRKFGSPEKPILRGKYETIEPVLDDYDKEAFEKYKAKTQRRNASIEAEARAKHTADADAKARAKLSGDAEAKAKLAKARSIRDQKRSISRDLSNPELKKGGNAESLNEHGMRVVQTQQPQPLHGAVNASSHDKHGMCTVRAQQPELLRSVGTASAFERHGMRVVQAEQPELLATTATTLERAGSKARRMRREGSRANLRKPLPQLGESDLPSPFLREDEKKMAEEEKLDRLTRQASVMLITGRRPDETVRLTPRLNFDEYDENYQLKPLTYVPSPRTRLPTPKKPTIKRKTLRGPTSYSDLAQKRAAEYSTMVPKNPWTSPFLSPGKPNSPAPGKLSSPEKSDTDVDEPPKLGLPRSQAVSDILRTSIKNPTYQEIDSEPYEYPELVPAPLNFTKKSKVTTSKPFEYLEWGPAPLHVTKNSKRIPSVQSTQSSRSKQQSPRLNRVGASESSIRSPRVALGSSQFAERRNAGDYGPRSASDKVAHWKEYYKQNDMMQDMHNDIDEYLAGILEEKREAKARATKEEAAKMLAEEEESRQRWAENRRKLRIESVYSIDDL